MYFLNKKNSKIVFITNSDFLIFFVEVKFDVKIELETPKKVDLKSRIDQIVAY